MVVALAVDNEGEQLHPRKWNHEFIDLPLVTEQRRPTFSAEEVAKIVSAAEGQLRVLYSLLAGTGLRIGEVLALEVRDVTGSTIAVRRGIFSQSGALPGRSSIRYETGRPD